MPQKEMGPYRLQMKADLQTTPRKLGILNQIRFMAMGPGSLAWMACCVMLLIASWTGIKDVFREWTALSNPLRTQGEVKYLDESGWEIGGRTEYLITFTYEVGGTTFEAASYSTTQWPEPGTFVEIEYAPSDPLVSRVVGTQYAHVKFLPLTFLALAVVAALIGVLRWRTSSRWGKLLVKGQVTEAKLAQKKATNVSVNNQTVYALTFAFSDESGQSHEVTVKTHKTGKFLDEKVELALYDPDHPEVCYLIDQLPFGMVLSAPGVWKEPDSGQMLVLVLRTAVLVGLILWTLNTLTRPF